MNNMALVFVFLCGLFIKATTVLAYQRQQPQYYNNPPNQNNQPSYNNNQPSYNPNYSNSDSAAAASAAASSSASSNGYVQQENIDNEYTEVSPSQAQTIQNNNNITVGPNAHPTQQAYIAPAYPARTYPAAALAYNDDVSSVLGTKQHYVERYHRLSLIPMVGGTIYSGSWGSHVGNVYSFGLALDVPVSPLLSMEVEGGYGRFNNSYGYDMGGRRIHNNDFDQFILGLNTKVYFSRSIFRPYVGAGITGVYYSGVDTGPNPFGPPTTYSQWVGMGQLMAGADISVTEDVAIGGRGAFLIPMFNRPGTQTVAGPYGPQSGSSYESNNMMNNNFYKLMATVKVAL